MSSNGKKIKQAFILGAGLGTRLRPITDTIPKVMVPIAPGKPLLEHEIELLRDQGISDIIINTHYLPQAITSYFGDGSQWNVQIRYSNEAERALETGGALKYAESLLDDDFLFIYGDHLYFFDFAPLMEAHAKNDGLATIVVKTSDLPENGDVWEFDPDTLRMVTLLPRPHGVTEFTKTRMLNSGLFALSKKIIDCIHVPAGVPIKLDGEIMPELIKAGVPLYAFPTDEPILDIGTPEKYEFAKKYYKKHFSQPKGVN